jgi:large subunit ribosomal protein L18
MTGPKTRVAMRRRREGKTNYQRRLKLVLSNKLRLVIRSSVRSIIAQIVEAKLEGDKIIVTADSKQLLKLYKWPYNPANTSSAYLTGYLCGMLAKKAGVEECILDIGIMCHKNKVLAAFKGFIDSGVNVPFGDKFFENAHLDNRVTGEHIKNYATTLLKNNKEKYEKVFSEYIKNKVDPTKIVDDFKKVKKEIEK